MNSHDICTIIRSLGEVNNGPSPGIASLKLHGFCVITTRELSDFHQLPHWRRHMTAWLFVSLGTGVLALLVALYKAIWVKRQDPGSEKLREIGKAIRDGAMAFLTREYKILLIIIAAVALLLVFSEKGYGRFFRPIISGRRSILRLSRIIWHADGNSGQYAYRQQRAKGNCRSPFGGL